jgi:argininosuccinate lyase
MRTTAEDFPYDPAFGEPYNSRERYFTSQIGDDAGWLHAGRPRREAVRIALRLNVRSGLEDVVEAAAELALAIAEVAGAHSRTWLPDQTYLQHAQPSTFGHYLASFAYPVLRDAERLLDAFTWVNTSPGGAGCVNGSRLLEDRTRVAIRSDSTASLSTPETRCGRSMASSPPCPMPRACSPPRASWPRTSRSGRATSSTT